MSQEKWFIFIIHVLLVIVPVSLSCSLPFVLVETQPDGYLVGKELVILLFVCVVGKVFCCDLCIFFPPGVYVGTLNLIASISDLFILTLMNVWYGNI